LAPTPSPRAHFAGENAPNKGETGNVNFILLVLVLDLVTGNKATEDEEEYDQDYDSCRADNPFLTFPKPPWPPRNVACGSG
jgi:hypothetical protein